MSRPPLVVSFILSACSVVTIQPADGARPVVVKAVPDNGAVDVDPNLREIRVTFDQSMSPGGMSVVGGGDQFPEIVGKPRWANGKTIVISVVLKPNHSYWLSINSDRFQNFRSQGSEPAVPYPISFRTGRGDGNRAPAVEGETESMQPQALTPAQNKKAVNLLRTALVKHYSHRDRLEVKWAPLVSRNRDALIAAKTPKEFAEITATVLAEAKDKHIWLRVGEETIPTYRNPPTPNVNFKLLPDVVADWKVHNNTVASGKLAEDVVYLWIGSWSRERADDLKSAFEVLANAKDARAVVIDVRGNGGGDERLARALAGVFVDRSAVYAKHVSVDPNKPGSFTPPHERIIKPNEKVERFRGHVVVLTGPAVISSCESFLLMMKQAPHALLVGGVSQGSSGNPRPHELENGVTVFLPSWIEMTPSDEKIEGTGIVPDELVETTSGDFESADPVIAAALRVLRHE